MILLAKSLPGLCPHVEQGDDGASSRVQNDFANNISECDVLHLAPHLEDSAAPHGRRHCSPSATTRAAGAVTAPGATTRQRCAGTLLPAAGGAPGTPRRQRAPASPPHRPRIAGVGAVGVAGQGGAGETPRVEASRLAAGEPARADDVHYLCTFRLWSSKSPTTSCICGRAARQDATCGSQTKSAKIEDADALYDRLVA